MKFYIAALCCPLLFACGSSEDPASVVNQDDVISVIEDDSDESAEDNNSEGDTPVLSDIDITDSIFTNMSGNCADYVQSYYSNVQDQSDSTYFTGDLVITLSGNDCVFESNAIPNHDFNLTGRFATDVSEQDDSYTIPSSPSIANASTDLALGESAVFLNGVKLDLLAAACYDVGDASLGKEKIGCGQQEIDNPWRYDPMSSLNNFGTDEHNAHTQPNGAYHYHGSPMAMFEDDCNNSSGASAVIGFAFDGFPIIGSCIQDGDSIREVTSSYQLKNDGGVRAGVEGYTTPEAKFVASDNYDGQFRGDWEFVENAGDLDECNGMTVDGQYAYYVTNSYPWVMGCYKGNQ